MMHEPWFWREDSMTAGAVRGALAPVSWAYEQAQSLRWRMTSPYCSDAAIICIGNATLGGVGKTPTALAVHALLAPIAGPIYFLSRGHGGREAGPILVSDTHAAIDVGDEPLLLAGAAPTYIARRRVAGAQEAEKNGASVIIMDDGYQNPTIKKDVSLLLVDDRDTAPEGPIFPAGPYREKLIAAAQRADAICQIGESSLGDIIGPGISRISANVAIGAEMAKSRPLVAFCGIGRPEKFFHSLLEAGGDIAARVAFPDHHAYTVRELEDLHALAIRHNAQLITTEKDFVRLPIEFRANVKTLPIRITFNESDKVRDIITARLDASGKNWRRDKSDKIQDHHAPLIAKTAPARGQAAPGRDGLDQSNVALPQRRSNRKVTPGHWVEYALTRTAFALFKVLGVERASALAGGFTRFVGPLIRPVSKRAEDNMRHVFPDWSEEKIKATVRDVWENLGRTAAEYPHLSKFNPLAEESRVTVHVSNAAEIRRLQGDPSVLISGHFANWEVMPLVLHAEGIDYAVIYRPVNNPLVDELIIKLRGDIMSRRMIPKGYDGARDAMDQLKAGRCVAMLADQKLNSGVSIPLLGKPAMTPSAAARLAIRFGVPVIPSSIVRRKGARFDVYMREPIEFTPSGHTGKDVQTLTIKINEAIGREIEANPGQWLWFHRRWPKQDVAESVAAHRRKQT